MMNVIRLWGATGVSPVPTAIHRRHASGTRQVQENNQRDTLNSTVRNQHDHRINKPENANND
jgi:hypothetical protein